MSVVFVGFAEWSMERGLMTSGEMDRQMECAVSSKYPCFERGDQRVKN